MVENSESTEVSCHRYGEYRAKGANALIFADLIEQYHRYGFKWAEAMPQMESNKGVQSQWQYLESEQHRRRRCYRKVMVR